jgi:UPF0716 protein FxsA
MVVPLFWIYVLVEVAVVFALASTIGVGWTLLLLLATFVVGLAMAGSQIRRQIHRLRTGLSTQHGAITDGALVALGTVLVVIPGLVTSALGLLLLLPPTRAVARPVLTFLALRGVGPRAPLITVATAGAHRWAGAQRPGPQTRSAARRGDYIDGEVVDVVDVEPPALPHKPE